VTSNGQVIDIVLDDRGCCINFYIVLAWTDSGSDIDYSHIPVPSTDGFSTVTSQLAFCPIYFENQLRESQYQEMADKNSPKQPLALLSSNYGATIDWTSCTDPSPLYVLQEVLAFKAASALQHINMVELALSDHLSRAKFPSYEHTKLETILHFDYAKAILTRLQSHYAEVLSFVTKPPAKWQAKPSSAQSTEQPKQPKFLSLLQGDFHYLISRLERLVSICDVGKATLTSNASIQGSKRSAEEAKLVSKLAKATNRITFIFLPISYVSAVFGMNFSQFGQGDLSIWVWVVITLPLLIFSVIVVERGEWIMGHFRRIKQ